MTTLTRANDEWSKRAPDERFTSLESLLDAARSQRNAARTATVNLRECQVKVLEDGALALNGQTRAARLTNWSFGQLCTRSGAPASYLASLNPNLAADCLNSGMRRARDDDGNETSGLPSKLLLDNSDQAMPTLRAITSDRYDRIFNVDIIEGLKRLEDGSPFRPAPAAFDGARGLYMGDRDMFAFMVDNERRIFERDQNGGLGRGFFCWNSEVGAATFGVTKFLYEYVCGNHRVWGAKVVGEIRVRHIGDAANRAFGELGYQLKQYALSSGAEDEARIRSAKTFMLGSDKQSTLDAVLNIKNLGVSQKLALAAYDKATEREDWYGAPTSAWGYAGGLTEIARDLPNADARTKLDRAGSKIMEMAL